MICDPAAHDEHKRPDIGSDFATTGPRFDNRLVTSFEDFSRIEIPPRRGGRHRRGSDWGFQFRRTISRRRWRWDSTGSKEQTGGGIEQRPCCCRFRIDGLCSCEFSSPLPRSFRSFDWVSLIIQLHTLQLHHPRIASSLSTCLLRRTLPSRSKR